MKKAQIFLMIFCLSVVSVFAQQASNIVKTDLSQTEIDRIVKTFTENEKKFRGALTEYVFNRNATIQTIGMGGQITGVYHRQSFMALKKDGERFERITYFPMSTVTDVQITTTDIEDLGGVNAFALEPESVPLYNFNFIGKEKIDDLSLYVFDVSPKVMPSPKSKVRLFQGRIWIDDRDLMIVKSKGKGVPEDKNAKYPVVETWRENVEGKYWFPAFASSDDELVFDNGQSVKMRIRVKYTDYTKGTTDVIVLDDDTEEIPEAPKNDSKLPPPPPPVKKP
ncbi:MAG: hypothetical protein ACR2F2_06555 [Pyrinomonadaceae bacterium]